MAVEDLKGVYVMAMAGLTPARVASFQHFDNPIKQLADRVVIPAAASIGSTIELGQVKTSAVLSALGFVQFDALAASTTLKVGLKDDSKIALSGKTALLNAATSTASAGSMAVGAAVDIANRYKPLWELAGLSADPGGVVTLVAELGGAASTGGDVAWEIPFTSY